MTAHWTWVALFLLGCYHGINPGMGWLFAVALGLQEKNARAVFSALPPIVLGHLVSVAAIVGLAALAQAELPERIVRASAAALLIAFGVLRLVRARHMRWVGMRVGYAGLTLWSFLMASGHGAGLMLLPFVTSATRLGHVPAMAGMELAPMPAAPAPESYWFWVVGVHTFGYVLAMTAVAWLVFRTTGVAVLRSAWFNFDLIWAFALIVSGLLVLVL